MIEASNAILELVLACGGTLSGEHGIGLEKLGAMGQQFTPVELDLLRAVRTAFDPRGILNPARRSPPPGTRHAAGCTRMPEVRPGNATVHARAARRWRRCRRPPGCTGSGSRSTRTGA